MADIRGETDLKEKYKEKLTVQRFVTKQVIDLVISFGSLIVGAAAGYYIDKSTYKPGNNLKQTIDTNLQNPDADNWLKSMIPARGGLRGGVIGAFVGSFIGQTFQGYERWSKHESERMAVEEINRDIAGFQAMRQKANPELVEENNRLREMLAVESAKTQELLDKQNGSRKILEDGPKKPGEARVMEGNLSRA